MSKRWSDVAASPAFQALTLDEQEEARLQYFNEVVAPRVPQDDLQLARDEFFSTTRLPGADANPLASPVFDSNDARAARPLSEAEQARDARTTAFRGRVGSNRQAPAPAQRGGNIIADAARDLGNWAMAPFRPERSVMDDVKGPIPGGTPIEQRGGPVTSEYAEGVRAGMELSSPATRQRATEQQGVRGAVARAQRAQVETAEASPSRTVREMAGGRQMREQGYIARGETAEVARTRALSDIVARRLSGEMQEASLPYDESLGDMVVRRAQDLGLSAAQIPAEVVRGIADITQLVTAGALGGDLSAAMTEANRKLDDAKSTGAQIQDDQFRRIMQEQTGLGGRALDFLLNNPGYLLEKAIPSVGSMALPIAAAGLAGRVAPALRYLDALPAAERAQKVRAIQEAVVIATSATQNAAESFTSTKGDLGDKYSAAAISGVGSLLVGKATGGGVEGAIVRGMGGVPRGAAGAAAAVLGGTGREFVQEFGEGSSNELGKQFGETGGIDPRAAIRQGVVEGTMGAVIGGGVSLAQLGAARAARDTMPPVEPVFDRMTDAANVAPAPLRSFTPPDSLSAQVGLTPIVVPDVSPADAPLAPGATDARDAGAAAPLAAADGAGPAPVGVGSLEAGGPAAVQPAGLGADPARVGAADGTDQALASGTGEPAPAVEPATVWFGRRGDGYQTQADAEQALPGRQKREPALTWAVEPMPSGRFRLAGYQPAEPAAPADTPTALESSPASGSPTVPTGEQASEPPAAALAPASQAGEASAPAAAPEVQDWAPFSRSSGTLGIPRAEMPQIKSEARGALVGFLGARGVGSTTETVPATSLKPTQAEFSPTKVRQAAERTGGDRAILVSSDGYVVDGHHQWLAKRAAGEEVKVMRLGAPIAELLPVVREFPSATTAGGMTDGQGAAAAGVAMAGAPGAAAPGVEVAAAGRPAGGGAAAPVGDAPALSDGAPAVGGADPAQIQRDLVAIQDFRLKKKREATKLEVVSPDGRSDGSFAQRIVQAFRAPITFIRDRNEKASFNALNVDGRIYINVDGESPAFAAAMHEVGHSLPPDIRNKFVRNTVALSTPEQRARFLEEFDYKDLPAEKQDEELAMRIIEQDIQQGDGALLKKLRDRLGDDEFGKIAAEILKVLDRLIASFRGENSSEFTTDIDRVRDYWVDAVAEARGRIVREETLPDVEAGDVNWSNRRGLNRELRARGEQPESNEDARRMFSDGYEMYAFHEQDPRPVRVDSMEMLDAYTEDQLIGLAPIRASETRAEPSDPADDDDSIEEGSVANDEALAVKVKQGEIPDSVVELSGLAGSMKLAGSRAWRRGRDLKRAMQRRVLGESTRAGVDPRKRSDSTDAYLMKVGLADARFALAANENAIGWYDLKTRQALRVVSLIHPEIGTDPDARFAFVWALAVTSNGMKVDKNFELAEQAYRAWKGTGDMPTDLQAGQAQKAINESLGLFNELRRAWGTEDLRAFMLSNFTVGEITSIAKELKPGGEHADVVVRGAAILGPKIGNGFFSNLYGNFDALTMDRWLVRTWGRWTGSLLVYDPAKTEAARTRLRNVLTLIAADEAERTRLSKAVGAKLSDSVNTASVAKAIQKASMDKNIRAQMNETPLGVELRKSGNSLAKYIDSQKEAPSGPTERKYIREIFGKILEELRAESRYSDLTMADLQAVLWYAEKRLYESAKEDAADAAAGYEDDEAPDYANAAAKLARAAGITERRIQNALKAEINGRAGRAQPGAVGQPAGSGAVPAGQQGPAEGFTRQERKFFIGRRAVDRARSGRGGDGAAPWTYQGAGRKGRGNLRVLGVTYTNVWSGDQALKTSFRANGLQSPEFYELERGSPQNAERFHRAISEFKASAGPIGAAVYVYPQATTPEGTGYDGMRLFLTKDGTTGFAIKDDGDIVSVFSSGGSGRAVMEAAIAAGGRKLDAFDTVLPQFYAAHGFRATGRMLWNDQFAPEGWDKNAMAAYNGGEPDVVFMVYDPTVRGNYDRKRTKVFDDYDAAVEVQQRGVRRTAREIGKPVPNIVASERRRVTETPEFKRWFGDSKVVDDRGMPIVVYHGTSMNERGDAFTSFDTYGGRYGLMGIGSYFTDNPQVASEYTAKGRGPSPTVYPVYLSIQNPLDMDAKANPEAWKNAFFDVDFSDVPSNPTNEQVFRVVEEYLEYEQVPKADGEQMITEGFRSMGHDGVTHIGGGRRGAASGIRHRVFIAFDPEQIKSATGNDGTFDVDDPSILSSEQRRQINSPAFRSWFGDSKVVDANGDPMRVFTGTSADVDFKRFKAPRNGIWFTTDPAEASQYAVENDSMGSKLVGGRDVVPKNTASRVLPVYLSIKNPMIYDEWPDEIRYATSYKAAQGRLWEKLRMQGYDGASWRGEIWVAFKPEQIKSAIGNDGTFDADDPSIMSSQQRSRQTLKGPQWQSMPDTRFDKVVYALQDKQIDLKRVTNTINDTRVGLGLKELDDRVDGYLREELYQGRVAERTHRFIDDELKPLLVEMRAAGVTVPQLEEYLHARHAKERNDAMMAINRNMPNNDALSGMSTGDAKKILAAAKPVMAKLAKRVDDMIEGTRDLMLVSGTETPAAIAAVRNAYQYYVPLYREEADADMMLSQGTGFNVKGSRLERAVGSNEKVENILARVAEARENAITRAEKNLVSTAIYSMAKQNPNPDWWTLEPPTERVLDDRQRIFSVSMGTMIPNPTFGQVIERTNPAWKNDDNVLVARIGGEEFAVRFNERNPRAVRMAAALKSLDVVPLDGVMRTVGTATRWLAAVNTQYNPVFAVVNFVRDVQGAAVNLTDTPINGRQAEVIGNIGPAMRAIWRSERGLVASNPQWDALYEEFTRRGGKTGFRNSYPDIQSRAEELQKQFDALDRKQPMKAIMGALDLLDAGNDAIENAVRLSAYKASLDAGLSKDRAASLAKNLTVNFNRKGAKTQTLGALYAFFNAAVQGNTRMLRAVLGKHGKKIVAGGLTLGVLQALLYAGMDDDDLEKIPEFVRNTSWVLPLTYFGQEGYIAVPMPLGLNLLPNLGRSITEVALAFHQGDKVNIPARVFKMVTAVVDALNPLGSSQTPVQMITPTVVDPIVQLAQNQDFGGNPLYRERPSNDPAAPGYTLARDTTSPVYKGAAYVIHMAANELNPYRRNTDLPAAFSPQPEALRLIPETIGGGVWRETEKLIDTITAQITGEKLPMNRIPLAGRFYGDLSSEQATQSVYYRYMNKVREAEREAGRAKKDGALPSHPAAGLIEAAKPVRNQVEKLRDELRDARIDGLPRKEIESIEKTMADVMKGFNETYLEEMKRQRGTSQ